MAKELVCTMEHVLLTRTHNENNLIMPKRYVANVSVNGYMHKLGP